VAGRRDFGVDSGSQKVDAGLLDGAEAGLGAQGMATGKQRGRILVIDDEWNIRDVLSTILEAEGYEVECADDGAMGIARLDAATFDLVITDLKMPQVSGMEVLRHLQSKDVSTLGIVATGYGSIESAVEALKTGAYDYITKPFHLDEIKSRIKKALEFQSLRDENQSLRRQLISSNRADTLLGNSASMEALRQTVRNVGDSDSTVLVLGESGTGKELVAKALHFHSRRAERPMIPVNCGAIPEDLLESELFGHVKGAFTGATSNRIGRFQLADGGTILLDEIGDMSPKLQVKILRVLQEQQIEPVGSTQTINIDVRVIAATNRDLEADVEEGRFREDLFYRLNVIPLHMAPLRERQEDIPVLIAHFMDRFGQTRQRSVRRFAESAMSALMAYEWPGNVRELENLVERMTILHPDKEIVAEDLPEKFTGLKRAARPEPVEEIPEEGIDFNELVDRYERRLIERALEKAGGVKNQAANLLRIKRTTLVEKMKKKGMGETGSWGDT
jgi:DNA-binding NtrC family response regulator